MTLGSRRPHPYLCAALLVLDHAGTDRRSGAEHAGHVPRPFRGPADCATDRGRTGGCPRPFAISSPPSMPRTALSTSNPADADAARGPASSSVLTSPDPIASFGSWSRRAATARDSLGRSATNSTTRWRSCGTLRSRRARRCSSTSSAGHRSAPIGSRRTAPFRRDTGSKTN